MNRKIKDRLNKFAFLTASLVFILGGIEMLGENKPLFSAIQFIAGFCNIIMVWLINKQTVKLLFEYLILILNVIAAITISVYYFSTGSNYIQYAWILVAVISVLAIVFKRRKKR